MMATCLPSESVHSCDEKKNPTCRIWCEKSHRLDICNLTLWDRTSNRDLAVLREQVFLTDSNSEHTWTWQEILLTLWEIGFHSRQQREHRYTGLVLLAALRALPRHSLTLVQMNKTMWTQIVIIHSGWGQNTYEAPNLASQRHFKTCPTGECLSRRLCDAICTMPCTLKYLKPFSLDSLCVCLSLCTTWCQAERSSWTCIAFRRAWIIDIVDQPRPATLEVYFLMNSACLLSSPPDRPRAHNVHTVSVTLFPALGHHLWCETNRLWSFVGKGINPEQKRDIKTLQLQQRTKRKTNCPEQDNYMLIKEYAYINNMASRLLL